MNNPYIKKPTVVTMLKNGAMILLIYSNLCINYNFIHSLLGRNIGNKSLCKWLWKKCIIPCKIIWIISTIWLGQYLNQPHQSSYWAFPIKLISSQNNKLWSKRKYTINTIEERTAKHFHMTIQNKDKLIIQN